VAYVFERLNPSTPQITKQEQAISTAMATCWTKACRHGRPLAMAPVVMYLAQTPHTGPVPNADALKVLDAYSLWCRTPEGEAAVR
jgi:para-nitrobenzyl esterase